MFTKEEVQTLTKHLVECGIRVENGRISASELDKAVKITSEWKSWPKGWTKESAKKFWDKLTGDRVHKRSACIKKMEGNVSNPGAFCQSLYLMFEAE